MEDQLVTVETYSFLPQAQAAKLQFEGNGVTVFLADAETVNIVPLPEMIAVFGV
jgi:hypothetical protein